MSIPFTGAGGLFTRIGRIGKLINLANTHQAALPAAYDSLFDQFTSQPDRIWVRDLLDSYETLLTVPVGGLPLGTADAQRILFEMVKADNPGAASSLAARRGSAAVTRRTCRPGGPRTDPSTTSSLRR